MEPRSFPPRSLLIEARKIIDLSWTARKKFGYKMKVGMTDVLFDNLAPFSEDAVKDHTLQQRVDDVLHKFKKKFRYSINTHEEFEILIKSHVKKRDGENISTYSLGKSKDVKLKLFATLFPDDNGRDTILFGLVEGEAFEGARGAK